MPVYHSVLNVKAVVAAFNQEKALVGAFSVIVQLQRLIVHSTNCKHARSGDTVAGVGVTARDGPKVGGCVAGARCCNPLLHTSAIYPDKHH